MKRVALLIIVIFTLVGCGTKNEDYLKLYKSMENDMSKAGEALITNNPDLLPTENNIYSIKLENLYTGKYLTDKLVDPKTNMECNKENSYIHVKVADNKTTYTVHLECGDYKTK